MMKKYEFKNVMVTIEDFECEVLFSDSKFKDTYPTLEDHYLLLRFSEDDDVEIAGNYIYLESNDDTIVGYYRKMNAKLFRSMLFLDLKKNGIIEINFQATERQWKGLRNALEGLMHGLGKFESYY